MTRDSLAFALSGALFGLLAGWIIGSQQVPVPPAVATQQSSTPAGAPAPAAVDEARRAELERVAAADPKDVQARSDLGNLYFDARRFDQAIPWYEAAFALDPKNVNVSTDLAVAYYQTSQVERAVAQAERSLAIDPNHIKTLLNQGIFLAFGKKDMAGARRVWERVVTLSPDTEEGRLASQGLQGMAAAAANASTP